MPTCSVHTAGHKAYLAATVVMEHVPDFLGIVIELNVIIKG